MGVHETCRLLAFRTCGVIKINQEYEEEEVIQILFLLHRRIKYDGYLAPNEIDIVF
jgi:hypothetical protein